MVIAFLLFTLLQAPEPELHVSVDQDRIGVGEEIVYTVRAVSRSSEPMSVTVAPLNGFEIVARSERTEVSFSGGPTRTTLLEMQAPCCEAGPLAGWAGARRAG